jgi:uncharacterized protein HemY
MLRLATIALNLSGDMRAWRARKRREKADQTLFDALRAHFDGNVESAPQAGRAGAGQRRAGCGQAPGGARARRRRAAPPPAPPQPPL